MNNSWFVSYHKWINVPFVIRRTFDSERIKEDMDRSGEWKVLEVDGRYVDLPFPHYRIDGNTGLVGYIESYEVAMGAK